jgi:two-component sensor histidine kinase
MARTLATESAAAASWLFLAEMSHRINNEYTAAICMLSVAAAETRSQEAKAALARAGTRLHAYARVHRALQMPHDTTLVDAADCVREVCESISQSKLNARDISLKLTIHPLELDAGRCWRLCLILSELITNAARHAFDRRGGRIGIEVRPSEDRIECRVSDNGCAAKAVRMGRGLRIINDLAASLGGHVEFAFSPGGSTVVLAFPNSADAGRRGHSLRRRYPADGSVQAPAIR